MWCRSFRGLLFKERHIVVAILKNAKSVRCWGDNESVDAVDIKNNKPYLERLLEKQAETDAAHQKRIEAIRVINPNANIEYIKQPIDFGDLSDWNYNMKVRKPKRKF